MKIKFYVALFSSILLLMPAVSTAQASSQYKQVDEYVQTLGSMDSLNMGTISHILTKNFSSNADKVRAIFCWIANNISFDVKRFKSSGNEKMTTEEVLKNRKANAYGYAALFQDMCSVAKIRCLTVDGYARYTTEDINEKPDNFNHSWAVVQLGTSPESWQYADPAWGSGFIDDKMTVFTKAYNDAYFFADKTIFNFQHLPDNTAWLLGPGTKDVKSFMAMPLVKNAAYELGLTKFMPAGGYIKTKLKNPLEFSIALNPGATVQIVALQIIQGKKTETKTMDIKYQNGLLKFNHKFAEADTYPVNVLINNKMLLSYMIEVTD
ncbi:MAG TPA: transglutaminase domain-containing protein [Ferruginibacter sp.]|nr:transglutaminase domain-containing protein [Ferruginibacter sp.]HMP22143.1 transglutaminase domain-containing protein [Ferruginibacter sp.]